jgi:Uma2 family endonuclease
MATIPRTARIRRCDQIVLQAIPWKLYEALRDVEDNWHVRMTYDRGRLELMSPSAAHERIKTQIGQFIGLLTLELDIHRYSLGQTTWKQEKLQKALEADESYYIRNEPRVRDQEEFDLEVDPPPDLVVEVEVRRSATRRMRRYASLGVPEVWRFKRGVLRAYERTPKGEYAEREFSVNLPFLRVADLTPFLTKALGQSETDRCRAFRTWVREKLGPALKKD